MSSPQPFQRTFLPGFIPGSLYLALAQKAVTDSPSSSSQSPEPLELVGFYYLEKPTLPPNDPTLHLQGHYWFFTPASGIGEGQMPVQTALHERNILGFARVAEHVGFDVLKAIINKGNHELHSVVSGEEFVFVVMDRLRRLGILRAEAVFWTFDKFQTEHQRLRHEWMREHKEEELREIKERKKWEKEGRKQEEIKAKLKKLKGRSEDNALAIRPKYFPGTPPVARPFTEFALCNTFTVQMHPHW